MLTYRTGIAGSASVAEAMTAHLLEQTVPSEHAKLAAYYAQGLDPVVDGTEYSETVAQPRRDGDPAVADLFGLSIVRAPTAAEIANILAGNRVDGAPIRGKQRQRGTISLAAELGLDASRIASAFEIDRILDGRRADSGVPLPADRVVTLQSRFLALYGVMDAVSPDAAIAYIREGRRHDGSPLSASQYRDALTASRAALAFIDLTFSAPKALSVAWALAPTEGERALLIAAHRAAVSDSMRQIELVIGRARRGKGGRGGADPGKITWLSFEHATARPTVEIVRIEVNSGLPVTHLATVPTVGDPQLHSHVLVPNAVLVIDEKTGETRVGGLDLARLDGRVHQLGALYQAFVAKRLRRLGVEVLLDEATGSARIAAIPRSICELFSKRTVGGASAARAFARAQGLNWDDLDATHRIRLLKSSVQDPRGAKKDDLGDFENWKAQAAGAGWQPQSVLSLDRLNNMPELTDRLEMARRAALPCLDEVFRTRAVVDEGAVRLAATCGLIAAGLESADEVDAVVDRLVSGEVLQDGLPTRLLPRRFLSKTGETVVRFTTTAHVDRETRLVVLARAAAADRSQALTVSEINLAAARSGLNFLGPHGEAQFAAMIEIGTGGRICAAVGAAGSGKTAMLAPLVSAWGTRHRHVYGISVAWRQAQALCDAGISMESCLAVAAFVAKIRSGSLILNKDSVVILDEVSLISTRSFLDLLEIQAQFGFSIVAVGDPLQGRSVDAGSSVDLLRRAIGPSGIPEISTTIRQFVQPERDLAGLMRDARAGEALAVLREKGRARLAEGAYDDAVCAIATLWCELVTAHKTDATTYSLAVLAPTARDVLAIGAAIRVRRRMIGEVGPDVLLIDATDQTGAHFELPVAIGDRLRLFARTNAKGGRGLLGVNGSIVSVVRIESSGIVLRNIGGREGLVAWDTLRDPESGRIRLTYGDAVTIASGQGLTATDSILALPGGSSTTDASGAYVGLSRHRQVSYLVVGEAAERRQIASRRPLGDTRPIDHGDIWNNVARNLSRRLDRPGALEFLDRAHALRDAAAQNLRVANARIQARKAVAAAPTDIQSRRRIQAIYDGVAAFGLWLQKRSLAFIAVSNDLRRAMLGASTDVDGSLGAKRSERKQPKVRQHFTLRP